MGYSCADCGDSGYTYTAWDGKGDTKCRGKPNHNLAKECPRDIATCEYRSKKVKSKPF